MTTVIYDKLLICNMLMGGFALCNREMILLLFARGMMRMEKGLLKILLMMFLCVIVARIPVFADEQVVYVVVYEHWNDNDKHVYHTSDQCHYYKDATSEKQMMTKSDAEKKGYELCSNCKDKNYSAVYEVGETVEASFDDEVSIGDDDVPKTTKNSDSVLTTSNSTTTKATTTKTTTSTPASSDSSKGKDLLTESQRRQKYASKTNPKKGAKVTIPARPGFNGYVYADFGKFNTYASENKLGYTPVYLICSVKDIVAFTDYGNSYRVAMLVNDCEGYQWYIRANVAKDKFDQFKTSYAGKDVYICGTYAGYSGVLNRPMIDVASIIDQKTSVAAGIVAFQ